MIGTPFFSQIMSEKISHVFFLHVEKDPKSHMSSLSIVNFAEGKSARHPSALERPQRQLGGGRSQ